MARFTEGDSAAIAQNLRWITMIAVVCAALAIFLVWMITGQLIANMRDIGPEASMLLEHIDLSDQAHRGVLARVLAVLKERVLEENTTDALHTLSTQSL